jgi:hypothetical protein
MLQHPASNQQHPAKLQHPALFRGQPAAPPHSASTAPLNLLHRLIVLLSDPSLFVLKPSVGKSPLSSWFRSLKGLCHEIINFLKVLHVKSVLYVYAPMVFNFLWYLVMEKI